MPSPAHPGPAGDGEALPPVLPSPTPLPGHWAVYSPRLGPVLLVPGTAVTSSHAAVNEEGQEGQEGRV